MNCPERRSRPSSISSIALDASSWNVAVASGGESERPRRAVSAANFCYSLSSGHSAAQAAR